MLATFPNSSLKDDFNRANGSLGANWTGPVENSGHTGTLTIWTNVVVGTSSVEASAYWNVEEYEDSEAWVTAAPGGADWVRANLYLRIQNPNSGTLCAYKFTQRQDLSTFSLQRIYNNVATDLITDAPQTWLAGDKTGFACFTIGPDIVLVVLRHTVGRWNTLRQWVDRGAVAGFPLLAAPGFIGFHIYGGGDALSRSIDDFGGGVIRPPAIAPFVDPNYTAQQVAKGPVLTYNRPH